MSRTGTMTPAAVPSLAPRAVREPSRKPARIQALQLEHPGRIQSNSVSIPTPGLGEALVRVHRVGVCDTDLHAFQGRHPFFTYPRVLGHELGVEVIRVGPGVEHVEAGDRCTVEPYLHCGQCVSCRRGRFNCCAWLQVLGIHVDGGLTEQLVLPASKLHASHKLSYEQLALVEPLATAVHAIRRAALEPEDVVAVVGANAVGLALMQFALLAGCRVIAIDSDMSNLDRCRGHLGLSREDLIDSSSNDVVDRLLELIGGELPTIVFDATGNAASMQASFALPAHGGRLLFVGLFSGDVAFHDPSFHLRELTLLSSRNALTADFHVALSLLEDGAINPVSWISQRATLAEAKWRFEEWAQPNSGTLKAMICLT